MDRQVLQVLVHQETEHQSQGADKHSHQQNGPAVDTTEEVRGPEVWQNQVRLPGMLHFLRKHRDRAGEQEEQKSRESKSASSEEVLSASPLAFDAEVVIHSKRSSNTGA